MTLKIKIGYILVTLNVTQVIILLISTDKTKLVLIIKQ